MYICNYIYVYIYIYFFLLCFLLISLCNFRVVSVKISMNVFCVTFHFIPKLGDHRCVWENLKFSDGLLLDE